MTSTIPVDLIESSPQPVRSCRDEQKLDELATSMREHGQLQAIRVRHLPGGRYVVVFGNRRLEAAKRLGWPTIEVTFDGDNDLSIHRQAMAENLMREDMKPLDIAKGLQAEMEMSGENQRQIAVRYGWKQTMVNHYLQLVDPAIQPIIERDTAGKITINDVARARRGLSDNDAQAAQVLEKVLTDDLSGKQVETVNQAFRAARDEAERQAVLESPYDDIVKSPALIRAKAEGMRLREREIKKHQQNPRQVAEYLEALNKFMGQVQLAIQVADFGSFSPEAAGFVRQKHDTLRRSLDELDQALGGK